MPALCILKNPVRRSPYTVIDRSRLRPRAICSIREVIPPSDQPLQA